MGNLSTLAHYISRIPRENKGRKIQYSRRSNVTLYSEQKHTHTHTHIAHWYARFRRRRLLLLLCPQQHEKMKGKKRKLINLTSIDDDLLWYLHTHTLLSLFFTFFNKYQKQTERREGGSNLRFHFFSATCFAKRLRFIYLCLYSLTHFYSVW